MAVMGSESQSLVKDGGDAFAGVGGGDDDGDNDDIGDKDDDDDGGLYENNSAQNQTDILVTIVNNLITGQVGGRGGKSRLTLGMSAAAEFRNHLTDFSEHYAQLGPASHDNPPDDGRLKSEVIVKENRRYYLDLKENSRGRFLKVSQTVNRGGPRTQIAVPAQGLVEFKNALTELLDEFGVDSTEEGQGNVPESRSFRVENKNFYFDIGQNFRGVYMRISEVQPRNQFRTSVTIPERSWARFRDIFTEYVDRMKEIRAPEGGGQGDEGD
ncbi:transcriptional activator protein Pur-alpha-like [Lytechinus pictus]|uniref:transcriptional activator protein Pur-alpha-like n=1 Tax=Lytechinus pictus TaxID=7653 RepID=UPI0030BA096E